jgi:hypothetical protein
VVHLVGIFETIILVERRTQRTQTEAQKTQRCIPETSKPFAPWREGL